MVEKVLTAISTQLGKNFGKKYKYYMEDVEQDLTKPCFTLDTLIPLSRSKSAVLYDRTFPIVIHYFTNEKKNTKAECYRIAEEATECLEYLHIDGKVVRGENMSWQIIDDVLQIHITYQFRTIKADEDVPVMEELKETSTTHI